MNKITKGVVLVFVLFMMSFPVFGHGDGHSHEPLSSEQALKVAAKKLTELAMAGKVDASWAGIKASNIEQKAPDFAKEWVVLFENTKIHEVKKQTLYLFFSLDGDFIVSSHDGN